MSKPARARIAALVVLGALGLLAKFRDSAPLSPAAGSSERTTAAADSDPREVIHQRLEAARRGDVERYIACHFGEAARRLEATRREMTTEDFARYLRGSYSELKGIAIDEPRRIGPGEAEIRVEDVYGDRNEAQRIRVIERSGRWFIHELEAAERIETVAPYGSSVAP